MKMWFVYDTTICWSGIKEKIWIFMKYYKQFCVLLQKSGLQKWLHDSLKRFDLDLKWKYNCKRAAFPSPKAAADSGVRVRMFKV